MSLRDRKIVTLNQWCKTNGYDGVTQECINSAKNQEDPKLQGMVKKHLIRGVAKK
tara:strand:- start:5353 stop:5517 length:165 start_codon:yes stop_codon:yes gene_type:complete